MTPIADLSKTLDLSVLKDKSVLVTGGASGLGALIATSFAENGAKVTVADINKKVAEELVEALGKKGLHLNYISTDVTDWHSQITAFKSAITYSARSTIDIVVAAAGVAGSPFIAPNEDPPSLEKDPPLPNSADLNFDVNAKGVYYTSKLAQHYFALPLPSSSSSFSSSSSSPQTTTPSSPPPFRKCLLLIASLAAYLEINAADYTASKWAIRGLFRAARSKMEDRGCRMNLIAPWVMDTPMSKGLADVCRREGFPVGEAGDVAKAVVRCAADEDVVGRAIAVGAGGTFDLRDDLEGLNAGVVMKGYLEGEARGFMEFFGQRV